VAGWIAVGFTNATGGTISTVDVEYDGEQWRNGGNTSTQTMVMEYGLGATFGTVATWTGTGFNFTSPTVGATAAALDGNAAANRLADIGGTISSLSWGVGQVLWFRWIENNDSGNDHGLAVDNFDLAATLSVVPELPTFYTCGTLFGMFGLYSLSTAFFKRQRVAA
jgi:hypothetical protein